MIAKAVKVVSNLIKLKREGERQVSVTPAFS